MRRLHLILRPRGLARAHIVPVRLLRVLVDVGDPVVGPVAARHDGPRALAAVGDGQSGAQRGAVA
jgi:hypothetical protein